MTQIVIGEILTRDGLARQDVLVQPPLEQVGQFRYRKPPPRMERRHFATDALQVRTAQPAFIGIDLGHRSEETFGHLEHLELARDGSLWGIGEVFGEPPAAEALYFSPECDYRRQDGGDVIVESVAVTSSPAQICMRPLTFIPGDLADLRRRRDWQLAGRHAGMLERAAAAADRRRGRRDPIIVHDVVPERAADRDEQVMRELELRGGPRGPLEHSPWRGRVLDVR